MEENWKNPLLLEKKTLNMSMYTEFEFKINGVCLRYLCRWYIKISKAYMRIFRFKFLSFRIRRENLMFQFPMDRNSQGANSSFIFYFLFFIHLLHILK